MEFGEAPGKPTRAGDGTRTRNLLITNQLLCQLSYAGIICCWVSIFRVALVYKSALSPQGEFSQGFRGSRDFEVRHGQPAQSSPPASLSLTNASG